MSRSARIGPGSGVGDTPLQQAVWRLRSRGCWDDAAALLEPHAEQSADAALGRAALLVEGCMFTG
ncbi:hypothetical protein G5C65_27610, partial [Streptomyces sp. SB3404]|nr:hypothetical protein [Streptomyces boncukensis]